MTDHYEPGDRTGDQFSDLPAKARAKRAALAERLGDDMPDLGGRGPVTFSSSDFDPCAGWFAAADLAYSLALSAPDINGAIEWTITGDNYSIAGEACQELATTLGGSTS
jgi:hypothetical protein